MNVLANHIELLLLYHPCVTLPGVGGFLLQTFPASHKGNQLLPPHTVVTFNASLNHDDGLLIATLSRCEQINYLQAKKRVAAEVKNMLAKLQTESFLSFGRLGTFVYQQGKLLFKPSPCAFLPQNVGYKPLSLASQTELLTITTSESHITLRFRRETLHRVAICVIGACLLLITPQSNESNYLQYANLSPINYAALVEQKRAVEEAERLAEEAAHQEALKELKRGNCHVVVATTTHKDAQRVYKKLLKQGYDAQVYKYTNKQSCVAIASYTTKKEALQKMKTIRQTTPYKRAWVWIQ